MDAIAYLQRQLAHAWHLSEAVCGDLTDEQLNRVPPGTANTIGVTLVHVLADNDLFIHTILQGRPRLWDAAGWGARLGLAIPPVNEAGWEEIRRVPLGATAVLAYQRAVRAAADAYVAGLSAEALDRTVVLDGEEQPAAEILAALVAHTLLHVGEIAALKGLHGARGLPF